MEMIWFCEECGRGFSSRRAYCCHKLIHRQPVKEDKNLERPSQAVPVDNLLSTTGSWVNVKEFLKRSWASTVMRSRSAMTDNSGGKNRNRGGQEDDKMKQAGNDRMVFDKIPQPNREDPELTKKSRNKRKLDDESKDRKKFFCDICFEQLSSDQALKEHVPSHNYNWWQWVDLSDGASASRAQAPPLDMGTREGSTNATGGEAEQYKCNICGMWPDLLPNRASTRRAQAPHSIGSPAGNTSQGTAEGRRPVLEFDLNEPPPSAG